MTVFLVVAVLLTLACVAVVTIPLLRAADGRAAVAAVCVAVAIPATVALLYAGVSSYPWLAIGAVAAGDGAESPSTAALREEARRSPGDPQAWTALADAYVGESRYAEARDAYREAMRSDGGGSDELRLAFAETSILVDRGALGGEAGTIVEDILARDPANPKALWYGGMAALARDDAAAARARWSRLLELSPPPQVRQIIEQQLANLDSGPGTPTTATAAAGGQPASIPVRVTVDPKLASRIRPGAVLFLFAREPAGAGPPLAVARRSAAELPLETALSDADSMVPGRTLAGVAEVRVTARVANDGEALSAPGDVFGEATWRSGGGPLDITIDRVVE